MKKGLDAISPRTRQMWNEVVKKYGRHTYTLAVNGNDEVVLDYRYMDTLAKGNRNVQAYLKDLLNK